MQFNYYTALRFAGVLVCLIAGCKKITQPVTGYSSQHLVETTDTLAQRNIILIVCDDLGYETLTCNGGESYNTNNMDKIAADGMRYTNFHTCPNCSPTRVSLLTGKWNFRNYTEWGVLTLSNRTIANELHDAGYATAVFGKWQLDGGKASIHHFGFDEYDVLEPFKLPGDSEADNRYKNPVLYRHGHYDTLWGSYADDALAADVIQFANASKKPYFIYYPMSLVHVPFSPTPDDPEFSTWNPDVFHFNGRKFFPSMISYMDKLVGQVSNGVNRKTIIILIGDNGTSPNIYSLNEGQVVEGGKGQTNEFGTHVPLLIKGLGHNVDSNFIDLPDIYATILDIAGIHQPVNDGVSFYSRLTGKIPDSTRSFAYCYWSPKICDTCKKTREWVENGVYKVYADSDMYNIALDPRENDRITQREMTLAEKSIQQSLLATIKRIHPE